MLVEPTLKRKALFWEKVNVIDDEESCWRWNGAVNANGYGILDVTLNGKQKRFYAHRVSWEWDNQSDIPAHLIVRHKCDNPPCVRPSHLLLGTHKQNTDDKMERGRYVSAVAKIDAAIVVEIRNLRAGGMNTRELAVKFNLTPQHISNICIGTYWPEVDGPITRRFEISDATIYSVLMDAKRMTQGAAAIKNGISKAAVCQIVSGKRLPRSLSTSEHRHAALKEIVLNCDEKLVDFQFT